MAISDVLKGMREGVQKQEPPQEEQGGRSFSLTEEEAKSLLPYQEEYQDEIVVEVTGKVEGNKFQVSSVKYAEKPEPGMKPEPQEPAMMPTVRTQTVPYPS